MRLNVDTRKLLLHVVAYDNDKQTLNIVGKKGNVNTLDWDVELSNFH